MTAAQLLALQGRGGGFGAAMGGMAPSMGAPRMTQADYNRFRTQRLGTPMTGPAFIQAPFDPLGTAISSQPMNDDQWALLINAENAEKLRNLRTKADVQKGFDESRFLESVRPQDLSQIYDAPADPRQAALQQLLNRDFMARERGSRMSMAGMLWNDEIARKMAPYYLDVAQFKAGEKDREQRRRLQELQIEGLQDYRNQQLGLRQQAQEGLQDYRGQTLAQGDQRIANQQTYRQGQLGLGQQRLQSQQQQQQQTQTQNQLAMAIQAAQRGAPVEQLQQAFASLMPRLTPAQGQIAEAVLQERAMRGTNAGVAADRYNVALQQNMRRAQEEGRSPDDAVAWTEAEIGRNPSARGQLLYNPSLNRFIPLAGLQQRPQMQPILNTGRAGTEGNFAASFAPEAMAAMAQPEVQMQGESIPVPMQRRGNYVNGRVYVINGLPYRYQDGVMTR